MKSNLTTSIIAGKYKGIKLDLPSLESTRSTKSIIKESLFNTLQFDVVGENFIEVFGGSGSIGLEALSRGAKHAYFIELDKKAYGILKSNCKKVSFLDTSCYNANSFETLQKVLKELTTPAYIYIDPPFSIREGMQDVYQKTINLIENIPSSLAILIVVEHMSTWEMPESIGAYSIQKVKKFGKSTLSYYQ
jgi:16S rRNA (guanine966-N2)-methyltransferase